MSLPDRPETSHRPTRVTGILRLPKAPMSIWDRGVGLHPGWATPHIVEARRRSLPIEVATMRRLLAAHNPKVLAAFNLECDGEPETAGDVALRIRRASIETSEQAMATADFHANPAPLTTKALLRETLESIGALSLLAAELKARIAIEEMRP